MTDQEQDDQLMTPAEELDTDSAESTEAAENVREGRDRFLAEGNDDRFKWYIARTKTGQENKVAEALKERIINHQLTEYFAEILLPEETVTSNVNGKKRTLKKKFFPGHVLIKMVMNDTTWHLVKETDKITGFVGGDANKPIPLSEEEAAAMSDQIEQGFKKSRTSINFSEGDTVKVIEGPFTSFVGTVEAISEKGKIKVSVSIFGRPTPVELDFSQVEKVI